MSGFANAQRQPTFPKPITPTKSNPAGVTKGPKGETHPSNDSTPNSSHTASAKWKVALAAGMPQ